MKAILYVLLVVGLVPLQTTVLNHVSVLDVRPDLCLIAACLIGFLAGETEGLLMGIALGFVQDLFSAGAWGLNLAEKGAVGFLAGVLWRQMANPTAPAILLAVLGLSLFSGTVFLAALRIGGDLPDPLFAARAVAVPQALFDGALGAGLYWLLMAWRRRRLAASGEVPRLGR
ncbi:rod shape-determining protein MreD [Nitrospira sp. Kam-Ns4a]